MIGPLLAAEQIVREIEWSLPESPLAWIAMVIGVMALVVFVVVCYRRDTSDRSRWWTAWLLLLRLGVVAGLLLVLVNPRQRVRLRTFRPSRVILLVDSSLSMSFPETRPGSGSDGERSRAMALRELLAESSLIERLTRDHQVRVYTFDAGLKEDPVFDFPSRDPRGRGEQAVAGLDAAAGGTADNENGLNLPGVEEWDRAIRPWSVGGDANVVTGGLETRLGEALLAVLQREGGEGLAGVAVMTDGASNAGTDPAPATELAADRKVRLFAVGVGSLELPDNIQLINVQAPTDVHVGDAYGFSVFVKGQGAGVLDKDIQVELLRKPESAEGEPDEKVDVQTVRLPDDSGPIEVKFELTPDTAGRFEFLVRAVSPEAVSELSDDDNRRRRLVNVTERKLKVLLLAGGPMRDYRFVRNMLFRHPGIEVDVLLQSADPGDAISQEADHLLQEFPETREDLFTYDVIVGFDPNWAAIAEPRRQLLSEWVFKQAGGLVVVAGDVYTPELAAAENQLDDIRTLYPVVLEPVSLEVDLTRKSDQAWPVEFSDDGSGAAFLQLSDDAEDPLEVWGEFPGVYRCYPTSGPKDGALVYARFSDPRSDHPVLMASQFFGGGRVLYVGSPELWRLRSLEEEVFDRFWIKAIREMGQARLKRGTNRGTLLLDRTEYLLGQTIAVRAHLLDAQFQDLTNETVPIELFDPDGRQLGLRELNRQPNRPGQFVGSFRASRPGTFRLALPIPPEGDERLTGRIDIILPDLESLDPRQNQPLLTGLVRSTGGEYLRLADAETLPEKLPNQGSELLVDEGRPAPLWDRQWVLYLLVGLLCFEWVTRKLLKLA
ncbi:MAG: hypothetical protein CMJ65_18225 [Planctomycetaceae bacterium]|jgi:hypothetical protein|nr:hypothetical protein [Planctomycetaceae bacterium]